MLIRLRTIPSWQITLGIALLVLGFIIAAQLRSEGPRIRYTSQERAPLIETVGQLQATQESLKERILELRGQIEAAERGTAGRDERVRQLNRDLDAARLAAGLVALRGPGLVLQLQDASSAPADASETDYLVSGRDIRTVVEELWLAGAEAIAVNEERITQVSAIVDIGGSILANSAYLAPPYVVKAIGPPDLYAQLSKSLSWIAFVRGRVEAFGIEVSFGQPAEVDIPAYAGGLTLRFARPTEASP